MQETAPITDQPTSTSARSHDSFQPQYRVQALERAAAILGAFSADEPELRDRPPWVMEEMIDAESALPTEISGQGGVPLLTRRISETVSAGAQIVVCGCGTSEHAARAISAIIHEARPTARVVATDAFETRLDPPGDGLLIAISHGATTTATRNAATQAAGRGARVVFITACPDAAPEAVEVAATPLYDRSWCHTVAYLSPILTCALGAGLDVSAARALIERELAARGRRRADAGVLAGCDRLLITASGVDEIGFVPWIQRAPMS